MRRSSPTRHVAALLGALLVAGSLQAQSATSQVTATVGTALTVSALAPLQFGTVFRGISKTIANNAAESGRAMITGVGTSQIRITFTFPANLVNGASTMPINQFSIRINGANDITGGQQFNLVTGQALIGPLTAGSVFMWFGARVQPGGAQALGAYTGNIVVAAAYTGL